MLIITHILRLGEAPHLPAPLDDDSRARMLVCLQLLACPEEEAVKVGGLACCTRLSASTRPASPPHKAIRCMMPGLQRRTHTHTHTNTQVRIQTYTHVHTHVHTQAHINTHSYTHMQLPPSNTPPQVWLEGCKSSFSALTSEKQIQDAAAQKKEEAKGAAQPDDLIDFVQLKAKKGLTQIEIEDEVSTGVWCERCWRGCHGVGMGAGACN